MTPTATRAPTPSSFRSPSNALVFNPVDYPILTESTIAPYLADRPKLAARIDPHTVEAREVGDGNLNLVFVCRDEFGSSLVLKQSLPYVRVDPSWPLTADRSRSEAIGLSEAHAVSPATAPMLFEYDHGQHVIAMEDLSDLTVWRAALDSGVVTTGADEACGRHIARLAFATSPFGRPGEDFRRSRAEATNPELCRITEDLVFTNWLIDHKHNAVADRVAPVVDELSSLSPLRAEVGRLKAEFMTRAEALIHGDLHTGSVMVGSTPDRLVKVIDTEFCCYGPVAFDVGMLIANALFAHARAAALDRADQRRWLSDFPHRFFAAFVDEIWSLWPSRVDSAIDDELANRWLSRVELDTIGFAACEAIRRVVGFAKVSDLQSLDPDQHVAAATDVLRTAQRFLLEPPTQIGASLFTA